MKNPFFRLFARRRAAPKWGDLTPAEQNAIARKIAPAVSRISAMARGYEAVTPPFSEQRRASYIETKGEDKMLTPAERARIINLNRDMMRNSPVRMMQDQQIRVHVVGSCGGKLYASFPAGFEAAASEVMHYFNKVFFPAAEFTFYQNFNWLLKTVLTAEDVGGNVILVFDDGILTGGDGTGRIRAFEADEIAEIPQDEFAKRFPKDYTQSRGFVYDASGVFAGCFVSTSQRGKGVFDPAAGFMTLRTSAELGVRNAELPAAPATITPHSALLTPHSALQNWVALGNMRRFNQGRAVSPLVAALTTLVDLHETCASEAQAAKLNAQLVGQILQESNAEGDDYAPITAAAESAEPQKFSLKELQSIGAHFDQMPEGLKVELLDTKRPNMNIVNYAEFLTGQIGGVKGLARVYATMKAQTSYTAFRGEQVMSQPSFEEMQSDLERLVCDWAARLAISRAVRLGMIAAPLPDGWENMLAWQWPKMREVSEADAQRALQLKLQNGTTSLQRELPPGEYERIREERRREAADARADGLIYQGAQTISGQPAAPDNSETSETSENSDDSDPLSQASLEKLYNEIMDGREGGE